MHLGEAGRLTGGWAPRDPGQAKIPVAVEPQGGDEPSRYGLSVPKRPPVPSSLGGRKRREELPRLHLGGSSSAPSVERVLPIAGAKLSSISRSDPPDRSTRAPGRLALAARDEGEEPGSEGDEDHAAHR
jgi:hypothetical protein